MNMGQFFVVLKVKWEVRVSLECVCGIPTVTCAYNHVV